MWLEFSRRALLLLPSVLFGLSLLPLSEYEYPPVVWTMMLILCHDFTNSEYLASAPSSSTWMNANFLILVPQCGDTKFEDVKRQMFNSGWESKGVWSSRTHIHKVRGISIDAFNIEKWKIHLKHEPRCKRLDINSSTSGDFSCLGLETDKEGLLQLREIY